ncbi:MAG: PD40 domain-containing protein [Candidatus Coatesbacteria bacterium]|nr:PD40 domain-containing protein [Candidatus Coatesbacteria bacterium]
MKRNFTIVITIILLTFIWSCYDDPVDENNNSTGTKAKRLFGTDGNEYNPILSPNGQFIAFNSDIADESGGSGTLVVLWKYILSSQKIERLCTAYEYTDTVILGQEGVDWAYRQITEEYMVSEADTMGSTKHNQPCSIPLQQWQCFLNYCDPNSVNFKLNGVKLDSVEVVWDQLVQPYKSRINNLHKAANKKFGVGDVLQITYSAWTSADSTNAYEKHAGSDSLFIRSIQLNTINLNQIIDDRTALVSMSESWSRTQPSATTANVKSYTLYRIAKISTEKTTTKPFQDTLVELVRSKDLKIAYPNIAGDKLVFCIYAEVLKDPTQYKGMDMDKLFDEGESYQVWAYNVATKELTTKVPLSNGLVSINIRPRINKNGNTVLFQTLTSGNWDIYKVNFDGSGLAALITSEYDDENPRWHSTANKILYTSNPYETSVYRNSDIFEFNLDNGKSERLTIDSSVDQDPCYGPGNRIYYSSNNKMSTTEERTQYDVWYLDR